MLFNSLQFAIFFIIVYSLYLVLSHKHQNRMLLVASYIFYAAWDWRFLSLILISTALDYFCGFKIYSSEDLKRKKFYLALSVVGNLSVLGFFKYYDFFAQSLQNFLACFNIPVHLPLLRIILPVGVSFYTFQTMSYTMDIYRNQLKPAGRFADFALFVAFFPQLVAGPIERARNLLPQILYKRKITFEKFYEGSYLIFWGLFLKIFVADNLSRIVEPVFASCPPYDGFEVLIAIYAFSFQIFCDFAGYSNIARGLGKVMGFDVMLNFNLPYFSTNPREFWRRWHISLSSWLRDYLYIPLGGNRMSSIITCRNIAITMLLGGLWHGASWMFIIWGAYHAILLIVHRMLEPALKKIPSPSNSVLNNIWFAVKGTFFFHLICLGWLIFRAQSIRQVFNMLHGLICNFNVFHEYYVQTAWRGLIFYISPMLIIQFLQYINTDLMYIHKRPPAIRAVIYAMLFYLMAIYSIQGYKFIYFQF